MTTTAPPARPSVLRRIGRIVRRVLVTIVGTLVVAVGIVLLPLPGPGWLIIFGGLSILATEYTWAARLLRSVRDFASRWKNWAGRQPLSVRLGLVFLGLLVVASVVYGVYWYYYLR